ncbi:MAG: DUF2975 domain-containing protein [Candidatus Doudnabacteria bacterium]|nr:DUF2975 domain-containing protein [Candidatus Doudnabacteria bacterium]
MKPNSTLFLKIVLILMGLAVLTGVLWEPHLEGRNTNAGFITIYFYDPFLVYIYLGTIPFFFALYQAFKLLRYVEQNKTFSQDSVRALRNIKYCALIIVGLVSALIPYAFFVAEEAPPLVVMSLVVIFTSTVIAVFAALLQKLFQNAVDIKSENDLTV